MLLKIESKENLWVLRVDARLVAAVEYLCAANDRWAGQILKILLPVMEIRGLPP